MYGMYVYIGVYVGLSDTCVHLCMFCCVMLRKYVCMRGMCVSMLCYVCMCVRYVCGLCM